MSIGRKKFNMDPKKGEYTAGILIRSDRCGGGCVLGHAAGAEEVINWC